MPWIDGTYLRWFPALTWQCQAKAASLVRVAAPGARIVDLGAGGRQIRADVISVDWAPLAHTRVIADVQRLPFRSGCLDLALATGLLEHVEDERAVLREMQRVLRPGGLAHLEAPLLQPEHRDPIDCRRFTVDGLARAAARSGLTPIDCGFHIGPTVAVLTLLAHYLATWFDGKHTIAKMMSAAVFLACSIVFFPFKFLDRFLVHRTGAQRLAFGVYCTARKPSAELPEPAPIVGRIRRPYGPPATAAPGAPTDLIYLLGHSFSGSTLLTLILNGHPEIATCGEMGIARGLPDSLEGYACSCGELITSCPFWHRVAREMRARGHQFDPLRTDLLAGQDDRLASRVIGAQMRGPVLERVRELAWRQLPAVRRERERLLSRNQAFVDVLTSLKGCRVFLDSSKQPERARLLQTSSRFALRIVHLMRDGRAVTLSNMRNTGEGLEQSAAQWLRFEHYAQRARRAFPADRWLTIRYEDLCADPPAVLRSLCDFAGIDALPPADFRSAEHHVIGNRMRLNPEPSIRLDDRWKRELSTDQLRRIDAILGATNRSYGYQPWP